MSSSTEEQLAALQAEYAEFQRSSAELEQELDMELQNTQREVERLRAALETSERALTTTRERARESERTTSAQLVRLQEELRKANEQIALLRADNRALEQTKDDLERAHRVHEAQLVDFEEKLERALEDAILVREDAHNSVSEREAMIQRLTQELKDLRADKKLAAAAAAAAAAANGGVPHPLGSRRSYSMSLASPRKFDGILDSRAPSTSSLLLAAGGSRVGGLSAANGVDATGSSTATSSQLSIVPASPPAPSGDASRSSSSASLSAVARAQQQQHQQRASGLPHDTSSHSVAESEQTHAWFILDSEWLAAWKRFIAGSPQRPGPITNARLFVDAHAAAPQQPRPGLVAGVDYQVIKSRVWHAFVDMYGGGPEVRRAQPDLYAPEFRDEASLDAFSTATEGLSPGHSRASSTASLRAPPSPVDSSLSLSSTSTRKGVTATSAGPPETP